MKPIVLCCSMLFVLSASAPASAGLDVGDPAPALAITEWVQGGPVDLKKDASKKVHLIEFWAVWCPPCKASVPRLNKIQNKHKNELVIIGVTEPDNRGNSPAAIRQFVKQQGQNMTYPVAVDDRGATTQSYLAAAQAMGIPHAFLIGRDGKIAWQGSPLDDAMEGIIDGVVAGTYDPKVEKEVSRRFDSLSRALAMEQWPVVLDGMRGILEIAPDNETAIRAIRRISFEYLNKPADFRAWATAHVTKHRANSRAMERVAVLLLEPDDLSRRLPDLAIEAAKAGYENSNPRRGSAAAAYALALYQVGALDKAVALQQEALSAAEGPDQSAAAQTALDYYKLCKQIQSNSG